MTPGRFVVATADRARAALDAYNAAWAAYNANPTPENAAECARLCTLSLAAENAHHRANGYRSRAFTGRGRRQG